MKTYTVGAKCFLDTFSGLVPCVCVSVSTQSLGNVSYGDNSVTVKLTASRGAYKRGEILAQPASHVPPRDCVRVRDFHYRIRTDYQFVPKGSL